MIEPTMDIWTSGIVNVPLNYNNSRYTFFELDTKNRDKLREVLNVYYKYNLAVYVHSLIKGYHFYNFVPLEKEIYFKIIRELKYLNPDCPLITLRIIPNKWKNETRYWRDGACIEGVSKNAGYYSITQFKIWLENRDMFTLNKLYKIVHYPFERCLECNPEENAKYVYYNHLRKAFYCSIHNIQTIGRLKKA